MIGYVAFHDTQKVVFLNLFLCYSLLFIFVFDLPLLGCPPTPGPGGHLLTQACHNDPAFHFPIKSKKWKKKNQIQKKVKEKRIVLHLILTSNREMTSILWEFFFFFFFFFLLLLNIWKPFVKLETVNRLATFFRIFVRGGITSSAQCHQVSYLPSLIYVNLIEMVRSFLAF